MTISSTMPKDMRTTYLMNMKENAEYLWLIDRDKRERLIEFLKGLRVLLNTAEDTADILTKAYRF